MADRGGRGKGHAFNRGHTGEALIGYGPIMRIISGRHRGMRLTGPPDSETTRPIPDRVKESLFGLLRGHYEGARVVDLFAGTGSIGLETASRGAERVLMVERDRRIAGVLGQNLERMGNPASCEVFVGDALGALVAMRCPEPITLLFADPPYALVREAEGWSRVRAQMSRLIGKMSPEGFAVLRTPWPFVHKITRPGGAVPSAVVIDLDEDGEEALDEFEAQLGAGGASVVDVDLSIEGADGPETHAYGSTAVHLYMRRGS